MDEKGLGEAFGKLAEGKKADALARLTNIATVALTAPIVGPAAAVGLGAATEGVVQGLASQVSNSAIRRMEQAGEEVDAQRAGIGALRQAVAEVLADVEQRQLTETRSSRAENQEYFSQLLILMSRFIARLDEIDQKWAAALGAREAVTPQPLTANAILEVFDETTDQLMSWPRTLRNGRWLERPELQQLVSTVAGDNRRPIALLGAPGSGKSALLAQCGATLRGDGWQIVAIKADQLPAEVSTMHALREHLRAALPIDVLLRTLASHGRTVLLIDQLDALADLVDLRTQRLSVLLTLIDRVSKFENMRVICSAREFDFRHDMRFQRLNPVEIRLALPSEEQVDSALAEASIQGADLPRKLKDLLRTPQWLKLFLLLPLNTDREWPTTWNGLLEAVWAQSVLRAGTETGANEAAAYEVAKQIAEREELWVPRAPLTRHHEGIARLLSTGVLSEDRGGIRLSFAHQTMYEFARARAFVASESLTTYAIAHQGALFVRPTVWTALTFLREADTARYHDELNALWRADLRPHLRLLVIEFLGQQGAPDEVEASILLPVLGDSRWKRAAWHSTVGSQGWFRLQRNGYLQTAMTSATPGLAIATLAHAADFDRAAVFGLVEAE